ncbi:hypothetical protein KOR42_39960 [Thalassoglobus neptunius]|uniref:Uncharacterized protein n=1 Tax=Thalassoglobus neptunius TaxID=1938619 RepID=A0A5C5WBC2_9PLAN|nr:hypothetical protein [Thalassoglobus neptunius]TWT48206.1 hypothetical protein KOR42_39960 [Thalassoglobus neptunius]
MLSEFFESLKSHARGCVQPVPLMESSTEKTLWIDGEMVEVSKPKPGQVVSVENLESLITMLETKDSASMLSVELEQVVAYHEPQKRFGLDRTIWALPLAPQLQELESVDGSWLTHEQAVDVFRHKLSGYVPSGVLASIRDLKFGRTDTTHSQFHDDATRMSRDTLAQVSGAEKVPTDFDFTGPVYVDLLDRLPVTVDTEQRQQPLAAAVNPVVIPCVLSTDAKKERFRIQTMPGRLRSVKADAIEAVAEMITTEFEDRGMVDQVLCGAMHFNQI